MTPADHANTVREALTLLLDVPDNAETHEAALNGSAALDALQAQAEERDALRESGQRWAENVRVKEQRIVAAEAELKEAYAKLERTNESFLATEAERDRLRDALRFYAIEGNYDKGRIARAALAGDDT